MRSSRDTRAPAVQLPGSRTRVSRALCRATHRCSRWRAAMGGTQALFIASSGAAGVRAPSLPPPASSPCGPLPHRRNSQRLRRPRHACTCTAQHQRRDPDLLSEHARTASPAQFSSSESVLASRLRPPASLRLARCRSGVCRDRPCPGEPRRRRPRAQHRVAAGAAPGPTQRRLCQRCSPLSFPLLACRAQPHSLRHTAMPATLRPAALS